MAQDPNILQRDWIDWELADKLGKLIVRHMKKRQEAGDSNLVGIQIATQTLSLVAAIVSVTGVDQANRHRIFLDVFRFINDLQQSGWDKNEGDQRRRPN